MGYGREITVIMTFISTGFVLFFLLTATVFYAVPQKIKWVVLLCASYIFYALNNPRALIFIILSTTISFFIADKLSTINSECEEKRSKTEDKQQRKEIRTHYNAIKKRFISLGVVFCFAILVVLKYTNFVIFNINSVFKTNIQMFHFLLPLGISFYTFQVVSYMLDVYNGKYPAEKNLFHYALYVSWFPSILQGPISRYNELRPQFFETEHHFSLENTQFAMQRILWGFLKKLVIADRATEVVTYIFGNHAELPWYITFVGLLFYSIELYADFSGGMDVVIGVSELMGIKLTENFRQPFFSQSIAEFWRRWHITLGTWMKDYVFYPYSLSNFSTSMGKKIAKISKTASKLVPACLGNLLVFFIVGVWHGAEWHFIVYGLYNGILIVLGILFKPLFEKLISLFHIKAESKCWKGFRMLRTFILINIGWAFDDVTDLHMSTSMIKQLFTFTNGNLIQNWKFDTFSELTIYTVGLFSVIWLIISILKEKGVDVRKSISKLALPVRWAIYLALILSVPFFQAANMVGFIYAQF